MHVNKVHLNHRKLSASALFNGFMWSKITMKNVSQNHSVVHLQPNAYFICNTSYDEMVDLKTWQYSPSAIQHLTDLDIEQGQSIKGLFVLSVRNLRGIRTIICCTSRW